MACLVYFICIPPCLKFVFVANKMITAWDSPLSCWI